MPSPAACCPAAVRALPCAHTRTRARTHARTGQHARARTQVAAKARQLGEELGWLTSTHMVWTPTPEAYLRWLAGGLHSEGHFSDDFNQAGDARVQLALAPWVWWKGGTRAAPECCIYTFAHTRKHTQTHTHSHARTHTHTCAHTHTHACTHTHTCTHAHAHTHTHTHTPVPCQQVLEYATYALKLAQLELHMQRFTYMQLAGGALLTSICAAESPLCTNIWCVRAARRRPHPACCARDAHAAARDPPCTPACGAARLLHAVPCACSLPRARPLRCGRALGTAHARRLTLQSARESSAPHGGRPRVCSLRCHAPAPCGMTLCTPACGVARLLPAVRPPPVA